MEAKKKEEKLRKELKNLGYSLRKSRVKNPNLNDHGGYMIIQSNSNSVIAGSKFDLSLEDVKRFVNEEK